MVNCSWMCVSGSEVILRCGARDRQPHSRRSGGNFEKIMQLSRHRWCVPKDVNIVTLKSRKQDIADADSSPS